MRGSTMKSWIVSHPRLLAIASSLLAAALVFAQGAPVNNDAYTYVRVAELFLHDGIGAAFAHYPWASYSALFAHLILFGLDLFNAGLVINALFYALIAAAFVGLVSTLTTQWSPQERTGALLFATAVISLYPQLNEYRTMLLRDVGFWAFTLLALQQLIGVARASEASAFWHSAVAFVLSLGAALLFRVEALAYLLLSPCLFLVLRDSQGTRRLGDAARLLALILFAASLAAVMAALAGLDLLGLFARFFENYRPFFDSLLSSSGAQRVTLDETILADHALLFSQSESFLLRSAGAVYSLSHAILAAVSLPIFCALLALAALRYRTPSPPLSVAQDAQTLILGFALINLLILCGFALVTRFVSGRYVMLLGLLVALWLPLLLARWHAESASGFARVFFGLFFTYCAVDSFVSFGRDKDYLNDAEAWVSQYGEENPNTVLLSNSRRLAYASELVEDYDLVPSVLARDAFDVAASGTMIAIEMNAQMRTRLTELLSNGDAQTMAVFPVGEARNRDALGEAVRVAVLMKR